MASTCMGLIIRSPNRLDLLSTARRAARGGRAPCTPAGYASWQAAALRGRRQRAAAPSALPAQAAPLGTPIRCCCILSVRRACLQAELSQQLIIKHLAYWRHVPIIYEPTIVITEACAGTLILRQASNAGGSGARCAPTGSATGTLWVLSHLANS
jgi:hypothetical protein